jgi:transposase
MNATTVAVDLAKNVFQLAIADRACRVQRTLRLSRQQFERWFDNREVELVIMEACGSAHHWARLLQERGIQVKLLPARYVRPYVRGNKTDAADAAALLEAARCADIMPVQVKSIEQQCLQGLHRVRSGWMATRTARINAMRGLCREFGVIIPAGAIAGVRELGRVLQGAQIAQVLRPALQVLLEEIQQLEQHIAQIELQMKELARHSAPCRNLLSVPGIGLLSATALVAATGGSVSHFKSARHFAAWFGLTPKEHSSGASRRLGRISKRGDCYLRMLLTHGARAVLNAARLAQRRDKPLDPLRTWALGIAQRSHINKATCALANKLARICFAVLRSLEPYTPGRLAPVTIASN